MKCNNSFAHGISITQTYECLELNAWDCPYCKIEVLEKQIAILREALERIVNYQESRPWANRDKIAREALQKVGGEG